MSNGVTPSPDLTAFWEAKTERYCQRTLQLFMLPRRHFQYFKLVAAACALIYEYCKETLVLLT